MNSQKPVLSISLLCSGRENTTKKCLDSLESLREKVPCELIIVDTGCDKEMRELISAYTDIILPFTWCNDFSAARNVGLEAAKGEWFLYLDDDEWFMDTKEIEDFFLSGEYKEYRYACYVQRNYLKPNKDIYSDAWVSRMVCLAYKPRFVSSIHEYFYPLYDPCKLIHSAVEHFGYYFENKEQERIHAKRNITLLLDMIKKRRKEVRWWTHLLQEYRATDEYGKLEEWCRDGLREFKNDNTFDTNRERGAFYCGLLDAQIKTCFFEEAEKTLQMALADKRNTDYCRMRLYNQGEEVYYRLGNYEEAVRCAEKYVEYYELIKDDEKKKQKESAFFVLFALEMSGTSIAFCIYILAALRLGDSSILKKYFHQFNWSGPLMLYERFTRDLIDALAELPYDAEVPPLLEVMAKRPGFDQLWDALKSQEEESKKSEEKKKRFYRIARFFKDVDAPYYYLWYMKVLYAEYSGETEELPYYFERLIGCVADIFQLDDEIFKIAEKHQIDIWKEFEKISFDNWKIGVDSFFEHSTFSRKRQIGKFVERTKPAEMSEKEEIRYEYFSVKIAEAEAVQRYSEDSFYAMQDRFRNFMQKSLAFYRKYFKEEAFTGEMALLPKSCRVAVKWEKMIEAQTAGNRAEVGRYLKECLGVFPDMDDAIQSYAKCYAVSEKMKLDMEAKKEEENKSEMQALADQIKARIPGLLEQGMASEAYQILTQLQTLVPDDKELPVLAKRITDRM